MDLASHIYFYRGFLHRARRFLNFFREFYTRRKSPAEGKPPADSRDPEKEDTNVGSKDLKDAEGPFVKKAESGINVITGRKVVKIDAARQEAELDNGRVITYGKCLLATGGKPKVGASCTAINFTPK